MAKALYSDLFLIFTLPATGGVVNQVNVALLITTLYGKAAISVLKSTTDAFLDDERVKQLIITRASNVVNQWYAATTTKYGGNFTMPIFDLTKEDRADLTRMLTFGSGRDIAIYLTPSPVVNDSDNELINFFDVVVYESSLDNLEAKEKELLSLKTNVDFDYNDFNAMGYITVSDGTDFAVLDEIVGDTSGATGTVYKIDGNTLYLRKITGTWEVEAIVAKTATCTSAATTISFPFYIHNKLVDIFYSAQNLDDTMGDWNLWIRFEARWSL